jgi:dienelactone hydrolase
MKRIFIVYFFAVALAAGPSPATAQRVARTEVWPVPSMNLSTEQFLRGDKNGKPVTLAGMLQIPKLGPEKLPAVILIESSGGIGSAEEKWAQTFNAMGIATFVLDSFSARNLYNTVDDQSQLSYVVMMLDAYRALGVLAQHPRIDPRHIAIMGFSRGAVAAVYSSSDRFRKMYAPQNVRFDAHIGLYTPCNVVYRDEEKTTGKPIRLFHGIADDYDPVAPCRTYVAKLKAAGADAVLTEYPGADHAYDEAPLTRRVQLPRAQTTRNCALAENGNGQVVNSRTGKVFTFDDPCVERGPHLEYNDPAYQATLKAVRDFLTETFDRP